MNPEELVDSIGRNLERLLRWAYPGMLFLVLFSVSTIDGLESVSDKVGFPSDTIWGLVIGALVVGAAVYLFQAYVVTQLLSILSLWPNWNVGIYKQSVKRRTLKYGLNGLASHFDRLADAIEMKYPKPNDRKSYMAYSWAAFHATSITVWLPSFFYLCRTTGSLLDSVKLWQFSPIALLFLLGALYLFLLLTRVRIAEDTKSD